MKLYFKHSNNNKDSVEINFTHISIEYGISSGEYMIHTSFKEALLLIEAAEQAFLKVDLQLSGDSQGNTTNVRLKIRLCGAVRINP